MSKCRVLQNKGYIVTSKFGYRTNPVTGSATEFHKGVDIIGEGRTTDYITAHTGGVVEISQYSASAGYYVAIRVSPKCVMRYLHLQSKPLVSVGDTVAKGQVLGYMGATGQVTGAHLHWDICVDGEYIDPEPYLNRAYLEDEEDEEEMKYKTINEVPEWYRPSIQKLINYGVLQGTGNGEINVSEDFCRVITVLDRLGKI